MTIKMDRVLERVRRLFTVTLEEQHEDFARAQQIANSEQTEINFDAEMDEELPPEIKAKLVAFGRTRVAEMAYHNLQHERRHNRMRGWMAVAALSLLYIAAYLHVVTTPGPFDPFGPMLVIAPAAVAGMLIARGLQPPLVLRPRPLRTLNLFTVLSAVICMGAALLAAGEQRYGPAAVLVGLGAINGIATGVLWERWGQR